MTIRVIATYQKAPAAQKDFPIDFGPFLQADEKVVGAVYSASPAGLTVGTGAYASTIAADGRSGVVWLLGGTPGITYEVLCTVTTDNVPPRVDSRTIVINVEQSGGAATQIGTGYIDLVRDFGADPLGVADVTGPLQLAYDAANNGDLIFVRPGLYRLDLLSPTTITTKKGVTLSGPERGLRAGPFTFNDGCAKTGAQFRIYGTGDVFGLATQTTIENLEFFHPNQQVNAAPSAYGWVFLAGANANQTTLRNITAVNPYRLAFIGNGGAVGGAHIENVWAYPLLTGIQLGRCTDVVRIENVHFNPTSYYAHGAGLTSFVQANADALVIDGPEEYMVSQSFFYGYNKGERIVDADGDGFRGVYGSTVQCGFDICNACISVEEPTGLTIRGMRLVATGLVPNGALANAILFTDTHVAAGFDDRPAIYASDCAVWNANSRGIFLSGTSYGVVRWLSGNIAGSVNAGGTAGANAYLDFDGLVTPLGMTRTSGAGTIRDLNALII